MNAVRNALICAVLASVSFSPIFAQSSMPAQPTPETSSPATVGSPSELQTLESQVQEYQSKVDEANQKGDAKEAKKWKKQLKQAQEKLDSLRSGSH